LDELVDEGEPPASSSSRRSFIWLQIIAFLLGLALLIYVINRVGLQPIFDALLRIGFVGFLILLGISGSRHEFPHLHGSPARRSDQGCPAAETCSAYLRRAGARRRQSSLQPFGRVFYP